MEMLPDDVATEMLASVLASLGDCGEPLGALLLVGGGGLLGDDLAYDECDEIK